ncbi:MAG: tetratricopeptide repeat protein [Sphingopyxis sp.]
MALPPDNFDSFVREVDDAVRADRLQSFAKNYGRLLIGAVLIGLIAFGGWLFWQSRQADAAGERGRIFGQAVESLGAGRPKAAGELAAPLVAGDDASYRALALMVQANAAAANGDVRGASAKLARVAADGDVDQNLRNVALLRQILGEFDTLPPETVVARLRHLVAAPGPSFASAAELTALAELKRGNGRAAGELYKRISQDPDVSDSLKSRAVQMAGMLGVDAVAVPAPRGTALTTTNAAAAPAPATTTKTGE